MDANLGISHQVNVLAVKISQNIFRKSLQVSEMILPLQHQSGRQPGKYGEKQDGLLT
jgi:hypothetical protein